jgi:hypothetical protein
MSEIIGKQIEVGLGVENARGTAQTIAERWIKKINATIVEKAEKKVDESTRNVLADSLGARIVRKWVEGDLEGIVHADAIGYLLYNVCGAVSTAAAGSAYDHTFTIATSIQHASLSIFAKDGSNSNDVFSNGMVNNLEITASADDYVKFKASFLAKAATTSTDTPAYSTEYDFVGKEVAIRFADTLGALAGATPIEAKEVQIKFNQGLIADHILGAYAPDDIYNAKMEIDGTIKMKYDADTYKDIFLAGTYKYMSITITGDATIATDKHPTITATFYRVQLMDWNREGAAGELVTQPLSFKCFYSETDSKQAQIVLRNLTSEYNVPLS